MGTLTDPDNAPNDLSPDGSLLATSDAEGRMRLLDVETLEWIGSDARADTLADAGGWVAFAPDGNQFAALQTNRIGLWDGHTGAYQGSLPHPGAGHRRVHPLPPRQLEASSSPPGTAGPGPPTPAPTPGPSEPAPSPAAT